MNRLYMGLGLLVVIMLGNGKIAWAAPDEDGNILRQTLIIGDYRSPSAHAEAVYHVLAAELAAKRGLLNAALEHYRSAAWTVPDPRLSERATTVALFLKNNAAALELASRWHTLAPNQENGRKALALAMLRNNMVTEAVAQLKKLWDGENLDQDQGFESIGQLLRQVGDNGIVYQAMGLLREQYPKNPFLLYHYALAALSVKDLSPALEALNYSLSQKPDWVQAHLLRARIFTEQGELDKALDYLQEALEAMPEDSELRTGYARLLVTAGRLTEARQQFEELAKQQPQDLEPLYALGILATEAEQFEEAEFYFKELLERGAAPMRIYYELGKVAELKGDYTQAKDWYTQIHRGEYLLNAQIRMGTVLTKLEGVESMAEHFRLLRQENPQSMVNVYLAEAEILRQEGLYSHAFDTLTQALEQEPTNQDLLYARALAAEKIDRLDVLEKDLLTLLADDPDNGHALNALGYTLADRTDRYQEAYEYLKQAITIRPNDPAVLDSMGWVYYRLQNYQEALTYLRQAHSLHPDPEIASHLGEVLWVVGEHDQALKVVQEALENSPDSPYLQSLQERYPELQEALLSP